MTCLRSGALVVTTLVAVLLPAACTDKQNPWCEQLSSLGDLDALTTAVSEGDGPTAQKELERFEAVAEDAPEAVHDDMVAIADTLGEVVAVGLAGADAEDTELEQRREAANQRLAAMSERTADVSAWAETECGIHLD